MNGRDMALGAAATAFGPFVSDVVAMYFAMIDPGNGRAHRAGRCVVEWATGAEESNRAGNESPPVIPWSAGRSDPQLFELGKKPSKHEQDLVGRKVSLDEFFNDFVGIQVTWSLLKLFNSGGDVGEHV